MTSLANSFMNVLDKNISCESHISSQCPYWIEITDNSYLKVQDQKAYRRAPIM